MKEYKEVSSPLNIALLANHQFQGRSNDCGPFCAAIAINTAKKLQLSGEDLGQALNKIRWKLFLPIIRRVPNWATFPWGVVEVLQAHGMSASWRPFTKPETLLQSLSQGKISIVIIGSLKPPVWGHYMILSAYDPQKGFGFVNPAISKPDLFWMDEKKFIKQWSDFGRISILIEGSDVDQ